MTSYGLVERDSYSERRSGDEHQHRGHAPRSTPPGLEAMTGGEIENYTASKTTAKAKP